MGPVEAELDQRIQTLRDLRVKWVNRVPERDEEACLLGGPLVRTYGVLKNSYNMSTSARNICEAVLDIGLDFISTWNDHQVSREPVVALLEKARARAGEMGL